MILVMSSAGNCRVRIVFLIATCLSSVFPWAQSTSGSASIQGVAAALRAGRFDSALKLIEPILRQDPDDPKLLSMRGVALSGLGRDNDALMAYRRALKVSPDYLPALEGAAQIEYAQGDAGAEVLLERILKVHPDDATSHAMLGALAYKRKDCAGAVPQFELGAGAVDAQPVALKQYGVCLIRLHQRQRAAEIFQKLVTLDPGDGDARERLASLQLSGQDAKRALGTLQPMLQRPMDARLSELAAACYEADGKTQEAVDILNRAVAAYPREVDLYVDLAELALDHHSFASGVEVMSSGLRVLPDAAPLYLERGILYVQLGEYEKAEADFLKASDLDPLQSLSEVGRGKIAEQTGDFSKALATVQEKIAKNPKDAFLLYTRAEILAQQGIEPASEEFRLAEDSLQEALKQQPDLVLARNLLCTLYLREGNNGAAVDQARFVLQDDPKNESALYHLIVGLRNSGETQELPELLKRLAALHHAANVAAAEHGREDQADESTE